MQAHLGIGPRLRFLLARASKKARCLSISTLLLGKASSPSKILITATQSSSSLQQFFNPYGFAGQSGAGTNLTGNPYQAAWLECKESTGRKSKQKEENTRDSYRPSHGRT